MSSTPQTPQGILTGVFIRNPQTGNILGWETTIEQWINVPISSIVPIQSISVTPPLTSTGGSTPTLGFDWPFTTNGQILYYIAGTVTPLDIGTEGQILAVVSGFPLWIDFDISSSFTGNGTSTQLDLADTGVGSAFDTDVLVGGCFFINTKGQITGASSLINSAPLFGSVFVNIWAVAFNVPNNAFTTVTYLNPIANHSNILTLCNTSTGIFTLPSTLFGVWELTVSTRSTFGAGNDRTLRIEYNSAIHGSTWLAGAGESGAPPGGSTVSFQGCTMTEYFAPGDLLRVSFYQNSGALGTVEFYGSLKLVCSG